MSKAKRTTIKLGHIDLDVFQLEDGTYRMSKGQTCDVVGLDRKRLSQLVERRDLKPFVGEGSPLSQRCTKSPIEGNNAKVDLVPLEFAAVIWVAVNNDQAKSLLFATSIESIERRADAAFGKIRSEEERNERLALRMKGKVARRNLTDAIRDYVAKHNKSEQYVKFIYSNCSDHLNKIILGAKAKQAKEFYQLPESSILRNHIPVDALRELELTEEMAKRLIDERDVEPLEAVKQACVLCFTKSVGLN